MTRRDQIIIGVIALLIVAGVIIRFSGFPSGISKSSLFEAETKQEADEITEDENVPENLITVHIVGAVNNPGIYILPEGARVYDAVEKAGGASEDADLQKINMARPLFDGEQIIVPPENETEAGSVGESISGTVSGKININRATADELTKLNGIGDSRATNIVSYREANGPFSSIEEIMDVPNIGTGIFEGIKNDITVY